MPGERTISRFAFWAATFAVVVVLSALESAAIWIGSSAVGWNLHGWVGGIVGGLGTVNLILAAYLVDRACKARGLSRSGKLVEGRRPAPVIPDVDDAGDILDIRCSRSLSNGLMIACLSFAAIIFLFAEIILPRHAQKGREALPLLYVMFLGFAALAYWLRKCSIIRVDAGGVAAHPHSYSPRRITVPWDRIATCELVIRRDTWGEVALAHPVFKNERGKDLFPALPQSLVYAPKDDQMRLLGTLKRRFPKLDQDPLEL